MNAKKAFIAVAIALCLVAPVFAGGSSDKGGGGSTPYVLSEVHAEGYPTTLADRRFAELVEEKTGGRIKIEVYTGGTLYGEETGAIEALQMGTLAFTRVSASPVASYVPSLNIIQLPYLYRDADHMWQVLNGPIGQQMLAGIEESGSGLVGLCFYDAGSRNFYTTKPVRSVNDMRGLTIRLQNNQMMVQMVQLLGGNGVTGIGPNEVYSAIMQGTVDGAENNFPTYESMGDYEAARYFTMDGHTRVPEILLASKQVLDSMDPADVEIIKQCAKETQDYEIQQWNLREVSARKTVEAAGCTIIELTPAQIEEFQSRMNPLYSQYGAGYEDLIQQIINTGR